MINTPRYLKPSETTLNGKEDWNFLEQSINREKLTFKELKLTSRVFAKLDQDIFDNREG